ncbi:hypothetical protein GCM10010520_15560 [Rhizobium viscosum]
MATRECVGLQQTRRHACAALADPEIFSDLVETNGTGAEKQMTIKPGGDGRYAPRHEQPSYILHEAVLALV